MLDNVQRAYPIPEMWGFYGAIQGNPVAGVRPHGYNAAGMPMNRCAPFVALDNAKPGHEHVTLFTGRSGIVVAHEPGEVPAAFVAIERALAQGLHVAGYFSYELGY